MARPRQGPLGDTLPQSFIAHFHAGRDNLIDGMLASQCLAAS
jgi:hypothetical protein